MRVHNEVYSRGRPLALHHLLEDILGLLLFITRRNDEENDFHDRGSFTALAPSNGHPKLLLASVLPTLHGGDIIVIGRLQLTLYI